MLADRPTLERFRAVDREVLAEVYRAFAPDIGKMARFGFSFRSGTEVHRFYGFSQAFEQHDLVQEVFIRAFSERARMSYDGLTPYESYLKGILRNLVIDESAPEKKRFSAWLVALPALALAAGVRFAVNLSSGPSAPSPGAPSEGDIVIQPVTGAVGTDTDAFKTRGNGEDAAAKAAKGSIDLVCITAGKPPELKEGGACAEGSELYVAVKPAPLKGAVRLRVLDFTNKPVALIVAEAPGQTFPVADYTVPLTKEAARMPDVMIQLGPAAAKAGKITVYAEVCDDCVVSDLAKPAGANEALVRCHHKASVTVVAKGAR